MKNITFLGPAGATFSHDAYNVLAGIFRAPDAITEPGKENYIEAASNGEILGTVLKHGGFGAIAMETLEGGRVAEPLETFIKLLGTYKRTADCPFRVAGAVRMRIRFCLMARRGIALDGIRKIVAHPKAFGPCKGRIASLGLPTLDAPSNGEAARLVAQSDGHAFHAALGPKCAAEKYGLDILCEGFEDAEAITTFFLLAPNAYPVSVGRENRALVVFKVPHEPGALVKSLLPFARENLNLVQIHSVHAGNATYNFAIEIEARERELAAFARAMGAFGGYASEHVCFGPFPVLSR